MSMSSEKESRGGPLSGMRVIDWTMWQFGPVSTMMLADLGADVIKVESLDGDHGRQFASVAGVVSGLEGSSAYFESLNRNKRGIALDLKHPLGLEVMLKLVDGSDIFVENFRQGVAERLGLGYEDLKRRKPDLIYASATGYGPKGDDSGKPAFALTGEARAGSLWWAGPGDGIPYNINGMADQIAGIMLSYGVLGAVVARERFGISQRVDVFAPRQPDVAWRHARRNRSADRQGVRAAAKNSRGQHPLELLPLQGRKVDCLLYEPGRTLLAHVLQGAGKARPSYA